MHNLPFLEMLDYAMLAYSNTPTSNVFRCISFENCEEVGVQYYIGQKNDVLIVAFRGTDSLQDLATDLDFWAKHVPYDNPDSKIRVHSGFIKAYKSDCVRARIHKFVDNSVNTIYVTGHSYGAALALLCALDLQYNYPEKYYEVTVFGCPRVGNRAFVKSYNKRLIKTIRFENGNDVVTKIPPALFGFKHAGVRIHLGFPRLLGFYSFKHHSCGSYYQNLWHRRC
ncbi:hypothetical protein FACS189425_07730 [Clostridia bacterium]|nr:hypothetical protein FACS189425_07730 [Clostridia bacterium]